MKQPVPQRGVPQRRRQTLLKVPKKQAEGKNRVAFRNNAATRRGTGDKAGDGKKDEEKKEGEEEEEEEEMKFKIPFLSSQDIAPGEFLFEKFMPAFFSPQK